MLGLNLEESRLHKEYMDAGHILENTLSKRVQNIVVTYCDAIFNWTDIKKQQTEAIRIMHDHINKIIQDRKKAISTRLKNQENDSESFLLDELIVNKSLNDSELREEIEILVYAGHDTTALTLLYALLLIGSNPDVEEKLQKELESVLGKSEMDVTKHALNQLVYLDAVLMETLRISGPGPIVARHIDREVKLKNWTLLPGRTCVAFLFGVGQSELWGADAARFVPERWLPPTRVPHPALHAAFSLGKRNCIGKYFATNFIKVTLAHILRNYKVKADWEQVKLKYDTTLKPEDGHTIALERIYANI